MSLNFNGIDYQCGDLHSTLVPAPPERQIQSTVFFGNHGESEIAGGLNGRVIQVECWMHDESFSQAQDLLLYLDTLDLDVGTVATLNEVGGPVTHTYNSCRFLGFQRRGRLFLDIPGLITGGASQVWVQPGILRWRQIQLVTGGGLPTP